MKYSKVQCTFLERLGSGETKGGEKKSEEFNVAPEDMEAEKKEMKATFCSDTMTLIFINLWL